MIRFEQHQGRWCLGLKTQWLDAQLLPALPLDLGTTADQQALLSRIAHWRGQGYVLEDASVLSVFERTCQQDGSDFATEGFLKHGLFPRLIDLPSPRPNALRFAALRNPAPGIYPIVDRLSTLTELLNAGAEILQLRIKSESFTAEIGKTIASAVKIANDYPQSQLFINDYWQAAIEHGAYGVHLGQEDLLTADLGAIASAGLRLGVSSHAFWEVARAISVSPSTIACGPVFPTRVKAMPWIAQGTDNLRYWAAFLPQPVIGIGGIDQANLPSIQATGCASASVIQAIVGSADPAAAFRGLQQAWRAYPPPVREPLPRLARPTL